MIKNLKFIARLMAFLRRVDPGTPLPHELEPELTFCMKDVAFTKKVQILAIQGEVPDRAFFLLAGYIIVFYIDAKNELRVIRIYKAEQIIAIDAFMQHIPSPYYIAAGREAVMISISHDNMQKMYRNIPGIDKLARKTAASYEKLEMQRDELMNKSNREKVLEFYSDKADLLPAQQSAIPDRYIASYLRINIFTFRRIRKQLIAEGLL